MTRTLTDRLFRPSHSILAAEWQNIKHRAQDLWLQGDKTALEPIKKKNTRFIQSVSAWCVLRKISKRCKHRNLSTKDWSENARVNKGSKTERWRWKMTSNVRCFNFLLLTAAPQLSANLSSLKNNKKQTSVNLLAVISCEMWRNWQVTWLGLKFKLEILPTSLIFLLISWENWSQVLWGFRVERWFVYCISLIPGQWIGWEV